MEIINQWKFTTNEDFVKYTLFQMLPNIYELIEKILNQKLEIIANKKLS